MMGGGIKGGIIHGEYPIDLSENGDWNIGRGRLIPTLPNEAPWQGVAQWMGATESKDLDYILPNRKSFNACSLFTDGQLFHSGSKETTCGKPTKDYNSQGIDDNNDAVVDFNNGDNGDTYNGNEHNSLNNFVNHDDNANSSETNNEANDVSRSAKTWRLLAIAGSSIVALVLTVI